MTGTHVKEPAPGGTVRRSKRFLERENEAPKTAVRKPAPGAKAKKMRVHDDPSESTESTTTDALQILSLLQKLQSGEINVRAHVVVSCVQSPRNTNPFVVPLFVLLTQISPGKREMMLDALAMSHDSIM